MENISANDHVEIVCWIIEFLGYTDLKVYSFNHFILAGQALRNRDIVWRKIKTKHFISDFRKDDGELSLAASKIKQLLVFCPEVLLGNVDHPPVGIPRFCLLT